MIRWNGLLRSTNVLSPGQLDYERYQSRVDSYAKKTKRSDRDNQSLAKAESELTKATEVCIDCLQLSLCWSDRNRNIIPRTNICDRISRR